MTLLPGYDEMKLIAVRPSKKGRRGGNEIIARRRKNACVLQRYAFCTGKLVSSVEKKKRVLGERKEKEPDDPRGDGFGGRNNRRLRENSPDVP